MLKKNYIFLYLIIMMHSVCCGNDLVNQCVNEEASQLFASVAATNKPFVPTPKILFKDIIGMDSVVHHIRAIVNCMNKKIAYNELGIKAPKGILLQGPPGNGKTMLAQALANELKAEFFYASGSSFIEMYAGVGARRIRDLFSAARSCKGLVVIFIDEFDALASVNRLKQGAQEQRQTLNQLLCELDGFYQQDNVLVIAATNTACVLDKAAIRSGRFDTIITVPYPNKRSRKKILMHYVTKLKNQTISLAMLNYVAGATKKYSGADLCNLVNQAALYALEQNSTKVQDQHLVDILKKFAHQNKLRDNKALS